MRKFGRILLWLAGGLAALALLVVVGGALALLLVDWNDLRGAVNQRASDAAGRELRVAGDLKVDAWSWTPQVTARDVIFANASWADDNEMVRISEARVRIRLAPLLLGRLEVEELRLVEPILLLERRAGEANWDLAGESASELALEAAAPSEREDFPVLKLVEVTDARVQFRDEDLEEPIEVMLTRLTAEAGGLEDPVALAAEGSYEGKAFTLTAEGDSFTALRDGGAPYRLSLEAQVGATRFTADGSMARPVEFGGIDAQLQLQGESLVELFELLALPLPDSPPYALTGRLTYDEEIWAFSGFEGKLGESDLSGVLQVETGRETPLITDDLRSRSFRVEDIDSFWGGDSPEEEQSNEAAESPHLLPDEPIALPKLRGMDAKVHFEGQAVRSGRLELENIATDLSLEDGLLTLSPLELGLAEGRIAAALSLDARQEEPQMAGEAPPLRGESGGAKGPGLGYGSLVAPPSTHSGGRVPLQPRTLRSIFGSVAEAASMSAD